MKCKPYSKITVEIHTIKNCKNYLEYICSARDFTANIYSFLLCPVSTVVSLYGLHLIPYPVQGRSYSKKTVISFTIIPLYLEQQLNVNHTVKLQWKVGHN